MSIFSYKDLNLLFFQLLKFIGVSGFGWILDFCTYCLLGIASNNYFGNNFISCLVGASFVFIISPHLVFVNKGNIPKIIKYFIYIIYQLLLIYLLSYLIVVINNVLNSIVNQIFPEIIEFTYIGSKIIITPFAMTCNFVILKIIFEKLL